MVVRLPFYQSFSLELLPIFLHNISHCGSFELMNQIYYKFFKFTSTAVILFFIVDSLH
jgi:hypothetical protein